MKRFLVAFVLAVAAWALVAFHAGACVADGKVARQVVVVPQDSSPFQVDRQQMVRLTGEGIAGSTIVAAVDGPATIVAENSIVTMNGGHIVLGVDKVEFVIKPTGPGTVKVKITSTFLKAEPTVKIYGFEVK